MIKIKSLDKFFNKGKQNEVPVINDVTLDLYVKDSESGEYVSLDRKNVFGAEIGINMVSFDLPTSVSGVFDYTVELAATDDTSPHNNVYTFTQTVAGKRNVLLISGNDNDILSVKNYYKDDAEIDFRHITARQKDMKGSLRSQRPPSREPVSNGLPFRPAFRRSAKALLNLMVWKESIPKRAAMRRSTLRRIARAWRLFTYRLSRWNRLL